MSDDDENIERQDTLILDTPPSTPEAQIRNDEPDSEEGKSTEQLDLDRVVVEEPPKKSRKSTKRRIIYGDQNRSPNKPKKPKPNQLFKF